MYWNADLFGMFDDDASCLRCGAEPPDDCRCDCPDEQELLEAYALGMSHAHQAGDPQDMAWEIYCGVRLEMREPLMRAYCEGRRRGRKAADMG